MATLQAPVHGPGPARIALVDDDRIMLMALAQMLEASGFAVETHADSTAALAALTARPPDLAVLDVSMPGLDGFGLLRALRQSSTLPVMFLTAREEEACELEALGLGADDYLQKPVSPRRLAARINAVLRRPNTAPPAPPGPEAPITCGPLMMDSARHAVRWAGHPVVLTATEFRLLAALARAPGTVQGRTVLQHAAYGPAIHVAARTIDSHVKRVRAKMSAVDPGFAAIETVHGVGYRLVVEEP